MKALELSHIKYEIEAESDDSKRHNFIIDESDFNELANCLYQTKTNELKSTSKKNREKASKYLAIAQ